MADSLARLTAALADRYAIERVLCGSIVTVVEWHAEAAPR